MIAPEDLVIAKLEWSGGTSELQQLGHWAASLGIDDRLEAARAG